jgi:hypothetical protein
MLRATVTRLLSEVAGPPARRPGESGGRRPLMGFDGAREFPERAR